MHHVVQGHITLPLGLIARVANLDVSPFQIRDRRFQARHAQRREVIGILTEVRLLARAGKTLDHAVRRQVNTATTRPFINQATLVGLNEVAAVTHLLMPQRHRVATVHIGDHRHPGVVVDFTVVVLGITRGAVALCAADGGTVGARRCGIEVTQIGGERAFAVDRQHMGQTEEVLVVEVFHLREVILRLQFLGDVVVAAGEVELVAVLGGARHRQTGPVRRGATDCVFKHTTGQHQPIDVIRGDLRAGERLRQYAGIVRQQDRQFRQQSAVAELCF